MLNAASSILSCHNTAHSIFIITIREGGGVIYNFKLKLQQNKYSIIFELIF